MSDFVIIFYKFSFLNFPCCLRALPRPPVRGASPLLRPRPHFPRLYPPRCDRARINPASQPAGCYLFGCYPRLAPPSRARRASRALRRWPFGCGSAVASLHSVARPLRPRTAASGAVRSLSYRAFLLRALRPLAALLDCSLSLVSLSLPLPAPARPSPPLSPRTSLFGEHGVPGRFRFGRPNGLPFPFW